MPAGEFVSSTSNNIFIPAVINIGGSSDNGLGGISNAPWSGTIPAIDYGPILTPGSAIGIGGSYQPPAYQYNPSMSPVIGAEIQMPNPECQITLTGCDIWIGEDSIEVKMPMSGGSILTYKRPQADDSLRFEVCSIYFEGGVPSYPSLFRAAVDFTAGGRADPNGNSFHYHCNKYIFRVMNPTVTTQSDLVKAALAESIQEQLSKMIGKPIMIPAQPKDEPEQDKSPRRVIEI